MTADPYRIEPPFIVSYSGGRTSGRMLRGILDAYGGALPLQSWALFCNTGRERPETLDFVHETEMRWGVPVVWLEYVRLPGPVTVDGRKVACHGWAQVDYATASRHGEPFHALINVLADFRREAKGAPPILPNVVQRFCTANLKIRTMRRFMDSL